MENKSDVLARTEEKVGAVESLILDVVREALRNPEVYDTKNPKIAAELAMAEDCALLFEQLAEYREAWRNASAEFLAYMHNKHS